MKFSWNKNAWKALKAGLISAGTIAAFAGAEVLLQSFDSAEELGSVGIPVMVIPLIVALVASVKNYLKVQKGSKLAQF